jgi:hypothetical protein
VRNGVKLNHANPVPELSVLLLPRPTIAICQPSQTQPSCYAELQAEVYICAPRNIFHPTAYQLSIHHFEYSSRHSLLPLCFVIVPSESSATSNAYTRHSLVLRTLPLVRRQTPDEHLRRRTRDRILGTKSGIKSTNAKCVRALSR